MEIHQREFLLSRILAGYLRYSIDNKILQIRSPTIDVLYEANVIFNNIYNESKNIGIMDDIDVYNFLCRQEMWSDKQEKDLNEVLPKHIEYWKKELYRAAYKTNERIKLRKHLDVAKKELYKLNKTRHSLDYVTCLGVANYAKFQYIIEHSTFYKNRKYSWNKSSSYLAMIYYQDNVILEENLRELSHTSPWESVWSASKKNGQIFNKAGVELSQEQQRLIVWSSMYDSIRECHDAPEELIVNDDDMLDGWMLIKKEERESNASKQALEKSLTNEKIANANEVYLVAQSVEDARKIDTLNSNIARSIKKQRFNYISKHGQVNEAVLPDVKQQLQMDMNNIAIERIRKK